MGTQKVWDGTLSPDEFHFAAKALCEKWKESATNLPQWMWIPSKGEEGYLSLENVYCLGSNEEPVGKQELTEEEELTDSATLIQCSKGETHIYNFHIVYSFSYKVPVLYFSGYQCDGQPLHFDGIEKDLPSNSLDLMKESRWTFMTQEEYVAYADFSCLVSNFMLIIGVGYLKKFYCLNGFIGVLDFQYLERPFMWQHCLPLTMLMILVVMPTGTSFLALSVVCATSLWN